MSVVSDLVKSVVDSALGEILKKTGVRKRRRRRTGTAASTIREIEKLLKPARRQTSRKKTVRSRSKTKRRAY
ncbi:MAG: hypothetical protein R3E51_14425 [Rhizobiaceae bacterium]|jgi:hypothetical protein